MFKLSRKVRPREIGIFCHQFAITLTAGVNIVEAIELIGNEMANKAFGKDVLNVKEMVKRGSSLSASTKQFPNSFPYLFVKMAETGELGGSLDKMMENLSNYYEKQADLKSSVVGAILYPVLVSLVSIGVVVFLLTAVLPIFVNIYETMESELPVATQVLMALSNGITYLGPLMFLVILILLIVYRGLMKQDQIIYYRDKLLFKIPIIGKMIVRMEMIRLSDTLVILLSNGIDLISALAVVKNLSGNRFIENKIEGVKNSIRRGKTFEESLKEAEIFELIFYHMVKVGERSGQLDKALLNISDYYGGELKRQIKLILTILEPTILLIVGGIVFFIILAIMMPVFQIYSGYSELM